MPAAESHCPAQTPESPTVRAFRELVRTFGLVERAMQPHFARFGITGSQWGVLRNLHRAEREGVTGAVDRLERSGLVERRSAPDDQRAKLVGLTDAGRQLVQRVLTVHEAQIETILAGLNLTEQLALQRHLSRLGRHLEGLLARGPVLAPE